MNIVFRFADQTTSPATLDASVAAEAFAALLPLDLVLTDYAGIEKISDLPATLNVAESPAGYHPSAGDLTYYAPWGNLAIFRQATSYATGLVRLGRFAGLPSLLEHEGTVSVTVEKA